VANYVPFQAPAGGPNFYRFGDDVGYDIHVDNVGDGNDHIVFHYQFTTSTVNGNTFLYNVGPISYNSGTNSYTNWNRPQTYSLTESINGGAPVSLGSGLLTPPDNVGPRSTGTASNYHNNLVAPALAAITPVGQPANSGKTFAGQRAEEFFADLGGIFDLLGVAQPFGAAGEDYLKGLNVNSIVLQVPIAALAGPNGDNIIGVWATASRPTLTTVNGDGTRTRTGAPVQVSRLGNPLVNEVVVPLAFKDKFNSAPPSQDVANGFGAPVQTSELAGLLNLLYGAGAPTTNRTDLVTTFLTGIPGINKPAAAGGNQPAEELRLNMSTAVSHVNPNTGNRLGVLGGDGDGFPNGRRIGDDVVDIALQAVDGILCQAGGPLDTNCRAGNGSVPAALGDGVNAPQVPIQLNFPYMGDPLQG